jgi:type IV pilus assembly protein PilB
MAKIGDILIRKKSITAAQLEKALKEGSKTGELLGKTLLRLGYLTEAQFLEALAEQMDMPYYAELEDSLIDPEAVKAVSPKFVWHYKFMPVRRSANVLTIAVSDPLAVWALEDLKLHLGYDIERVLATQEQILAAIRRHYGFAAETVEEILTQKEKSPAAKPEEAAQDVDIESEMVSVIKLVNQILTEAVASRATDIHVEFYKDEIRVTCLNARVCCIRRSFHASRSCQAWTLLKNACPRTGAPSSRCRTSASTCASRSSHR